MIGYIGLESSVPTKTLFTQLAFINKKQAKHEGGKQNVHIQKGCQPYALLCNAS
jgi:hypothetical protein